MMSLKKQFLPNLISGALVFLLNIGFSLWSVPFLLDKLGLSALGIITLVSSVANYILFYNISLNGAFSRYLTVEMHSNNREEALSTFNTAFFLNIGVSLPLFLLSVFAFFLFPDYLGIEAAQKQEASILFCLTLFAFFIMTLASGISITAYSLNRLEYKNTVDAIYQFIRFVSLWLLFLLFPASLYLVGAAYIIAVIFMLFTAVWVWKHLTPWIVLKFKYVKKAKFRVLLNMSKYTLVDQISTLLLYNSDLILVNSFFGNIYGGTYSIVLQFAFMLRAVTGVLGGNSVPMIYSLYARNEKDKMYALSFLFVKTLALFLALTVAIMCCYAKELLTLWLGYADPQLLVLSWILLPHSVLNLAVMPLYGIQGAYEKVKVPSLITLVSGLISVVLAYISTLFDLGMPGIAAGIAVGISIKCLLFTPVYAASLQSKSLFSYYKAFLPAVVIFVLSCLFIYILKLVLLASTLLALSLHFTLVTLLVGICVYFLFLKKEEKTILLSLVQKK